jgi:hypothetical protein
MREGRSARGERFRYGVGLLLLRESRKRFPTLPYSYEGVSLSLCSFPWLFSGLSLWLMDACALLAWHPSPTRESGWRYLGLGSVVKC